MTYAQSIAQLLSDASARATAANATLSADEGYVKANAWRDFMIIPGGDAPLGSKPNGGVWRDGLTLRWQDCEDRLALLGVGDTSAEALRAAGWPTRLISPTASGTGWYNVMYVTAATAGLWLLEAIATTQQGAMNAVELMRHSMFVLPDSVEGRLQLITAAQVARGVVRLTMTAGYALWVTNVPVYSIAATGMGFIPDPWLRPAVGAIPYGYCGLQPLSASPDGSSGPITIDQAITERLSWIV